MKICEFVIIGTGMGGRVAYAPGDPGGKILLLEGGGLLSGILNGQALPGLQYTTFGPVMTRVPSGQ
jgi:hypothetical protein